MEVTIWDWERGEVVRTIDTSAAVVVFDPTGTRIATSRRVEGIADIWDARTGDSAGDAHRARRDPGHRLQS